VSNRDVTAEREEGEGEKAGTKKRRFEATRRIFRMRV
jgi:hypothetical protein